MGQLTDCWHQLSSYGQYIIFPCCCIACHMSSMSELVGVVQIFLCLLLTRSCLAEEFDFSLFLFEVSWLSRSLSLGGVAFHLLAVTVCRSGQFQG